MYLRTVTVQQILVTWNNDVLSGYNLDDHVETLRLPSHLESPKNGAAQRQLSPLRNETAVSYSSWNILFQGLGTKIEQILHKFRVTSLETSVHPFQVRQHPLISSIQQIESFIGHAFSKVPPFTVSEEFWERYHVLTRVVFCKSTKYIYSPSGYCSGINQRAEYSEVCYIPCFPETVRKHPSVTLCWRA